jgi:hypothetical protein
MLRCLRTRPANRLERRQQFVGDQRNPPAFHIQSIYTYNKKAGVNSGLLATFYTKNSTKICFRCRAADLRLSATHGPTTAFLHRQCPYHTRTPVRCMSPVVGTGSSGVGIKAEGGSALFDHFEGLPVSRLKRLVLHGSGPGRTGGNGSTRSFRSARRTQKPGRHGCTRRRGISAVTLKPAGGVWPAKSASRASPWKSH